MRKNKLHINRRGFVFGILPGAALVAGCTSKVNYHGYIISREALAQVPVGSSQEQALLSLGTPSTTSTIGGETFYYISSKIEERAFLRPKVTERRILAVQFDGDQRVSRIAEYGLQDGKVFDFVSRTTPTQGAQVNFIRQLLSNTAQGSPIGSTRQPDL